LSSKTIYALKQQVEKLTKRYAQGVEENNKRYQETRNYTERDKR
jgi:hypothetical protein